MQSGGCLHPQTVSGAVVPLTRKLGPGGSSPPPRPRRPTREEDMRSVLARVLARTEKHGECLVWTGTVNRTMPGPGRRARPGYPTTQVGRRTRLIHRLVYEIAHGPIPKGMTVDHLCNNRLCINVAHLAIATRWENTLRGTGPTAINARKTHCNNGHPLSGDNLYTNGSSRRCRECHRAGERRRYAARMGAARSRATTSSGG